MYIVYRSNMHASLKPYSICTCIELQEIKYVVERRREGTREGRREGRRERRERNQGGKVGVEGRETRTIHPEAPRYIQGLVKRLHVV